LKEDFFALSILAKNRQQWPLCDSGSKNKEKTEKRQNCQDKNEK
jgi:hypothetical protein